jgi:hypothetical protein
MTSKRHAARARSPTDFPRVQFFNFDRLRMSQPAFRLRVTMNPDWKMTVSGSESFQKAEWH